MSLDRKGFICYVCRRWFSGEPEDLWVPGSFISTETMGGGTSEPIIRWQPVVVCFECAQWADDGTSPRFAPYPPHLLETRTTP
jgi:hypothetical protein